MELDECDAIQESSPERLDGFGLSGMAMQIDSLVAVVQEFLVRQDEGLPHDGIYLDGITLNVHTAREKAKYLFGALDSIEAYGAQPVGCEQ